MGTNILQLFFILIFLPNDYSGTVNLGSIKFIKMNSYRKKLMSHLPIWSYVKTILRLDAFKFVVSFYDPMGTNILQLFFILHFL
jgi:hypothetical protein